MIKRKKSVKVILFGTFDLIHPGHRNLLKQARRLGDRVILVVARDRTVLKLKSKLPRHDERRRLAAARKSGLADVVVLGNLRDRYGAIKRYKPDVVCLGYDQRFFTRGLRSALKRLGLAQTKIIRLKSYKPGIYKTSKLLK